MSSELKAILVDDEKDSRDSLRHYITEYCQDVRILGEAENIKIALEQIARHQPDVVFLDVEMPFGNAFDLLDQIDDIQFEVIFVTAFSDYAVQALNMSASYYIMKPVDIDELVAAVEKVRVNRDQQTELKHARILADNVKTENKQMEKVVLPLIDGFEVIRVNEIAYCKAEDNFTEFHLKSGGTKMICRPLKFYEELLSSHDIFRIHKSYLVNLQFVARYRKGKGGSVVLENGVELDVAASRKKDLLDRF
ncbi:MAG: response regulator transcription factor [Flavobacteriia bacterium]|nr:response regulator transcription factor [Flavobacteriia bacterium]